MKTKSLPAINIQYPISHLILAGEKIVETRTYPLPEKYIGKDLFLIETPGKKGKFKARVVGIIRFTKSFRYESKKEFYRDFKRHQVDETSPWAWSEKPKWGWPIESIRSIDCRPFKEKTGIVFTKKVTITGSDIKPLQE